VKAGPAICDFFAGIHLYGGIVTALYEREKTGLGRVVEVSMQESVYASLSSNLGMYHGSGGRAPPRTGNRHGGLAEAPYNLYPSKDGFIAIICNNQRHFKALLVTMQREDLSDDPRFASLKSRIQHIEEIDELVGAWTRGFDKTELAARLRANRVPCAPVRDLPEVVMDENMHARGSLQFIDHPKYGRIVVSHSPMRYEGTPLRPLEPSRELGADNVAVLQEVLGLSGAEIREVQDASII
jgi:formyl-CoA transferase